MVPIPVAKDRAPLHLQAMSGFMARALHDLAETHPHLEVAIEAAFASFVSVLGEANAVAIASAYSHLVGKDAGPDLADRILLELETRIAKSARHSTAGMPCGLHPVLLSAMADHSHCPHVDYRSIGSMINLHPRVGLSDTK